ncbi:SRPBCC family protein [Natronobiforma cellulositropha]|uniref:SRPBCC family protein n=1 Tax=Natronobiforma cellulositropha TaxID=1679076 RepID=UPI0021D614E0|nr:SRPBCC family protein [Natronobiforma cellulositropha]
MDRIVLSTVVYRTPEETFPYLSAFERYPHYAEHLESVTARGDGGPGTEYDLRLAWWKLHYTAYSRVTAIEEPTSLRWELRKNLDAEGEWRIEPEPEAAPEDEETASRIYFSASYDPHSANEDAISLPRFVSLDWAIRKLRPRLLAEAERVVRRLVADVEGTPRDVELVVHESP